MRPDGLPRGRSIGSSARPTRPRDQVLWVGVIIGLLDFNFAVVGLQLFLETKSLVARR